MGENAVISFCVGRLCIRYNGINPYFYLCFNLDWCKFNYLFLNLYPLSFSPKNKYNSGRFCYDEIVNITQKGRKT